MLATTILKTFQTTPHVNQKDAQAPSVLQLMPCRSKFYTCNAILVCFTIIKRLFITNIETTLATKFCMILMVIFKTNMAVQV